MDWSDPTAIVGHVVLDRFRLENQVAPGQFRCLCLDDRRTGIFHLLKGIDPRALALPIRPPHPAFAPIWARGELEAGWSFLISPAAEGESLDDLLEEGPLPADRVAAILLELARAVAAMHREGPVLINLRTADVRVESAWQGGDRIHLPAHPVLLGPAVGRRLAGYVAPEVDPLDAGLYDTRADQFCLGVIGFELLTGTTPHNPDAAPGDRTQMPVLPHPQVPAELNAILEALLAPGPRQRFADDARLVEVLEVAVGALAPSTYGEFTPVILPVRNQGNPVVPAEPVPTDSGAPWDNTLASLVLLLVVFSCALGASTALVLSFW